MSFQLARKIKPMKLDVENIEAIFSLWFVKSKPHLPPDVNETEELGRHDSAA
jgi:hypothetical protein